MKHIKLILFSFAILIASVCNAQRLKTLTATGVEGGTATATVTNTGTSTLSIGSNEVGTTTTIHFEATKTSGTVAGTVSLYGSLDGTNFRSISSTTFTATDVATQGFIWTLTGSPCNNYRVTWTGTGTMVATFTAKVLIH